MNEQPPKHLFRAMPHGITTDNKAQNIQPFQLPWLDTARMNPYSEIGPEVAFLCVKDDKGHSLMQTSFAELPNSKQTPR